jgi:pyruvate formate lyase activating enzyme
MMVGAAAINPSGIVFNIQRFSIHDGPGIRTTVFLKGCPLRCFWCHNPEGIKPKVEVAFYSSRCITCSECVQICSQGAHSIKDGVHLYDRLLCQVCGKCVEGCAAQALEMTGKEMTVAQVMAEVRADSAFYANSGGGMTISGGEPLLQHEFTAALLACCKQEGIHTAVETSAFFKWDDLESLLNVTDLVMMDIKHMDDAKHRAATGVSNQRILANARRLAETNKPIIFHTPVIPGVNDSPEEIGAIASFVRSLIDVRQSIADARAEPISLVLLPFHRLAGDKYRSLDLEYRASQLEMPGKEQMSALKLLVDEIIHQSQPLPLL